MLARCRPQNPITGDGVRVGHSLSDGRRLCASRGPGATGLFQGALDRRSPPIHSISLAICVQAAPPPQHSTHRPSLQCRWLLPLPHFPATQSGDMKAVAICLLIALAGAAANYEGEGTAYSS